MDPLRAPIACRVGDAVSTSDDHLLGTVVASDAHFLTVEHGFQRHSEYRIPMSAVTSCTDGMVSLKVAKDDIAAQGWDTPPPMLVDTDGNPLAY